MKIDITVCKGVNHLYVLETNPNQNFCAVDLEFSLYSSMGGREEMRLRGDVLSSSAISLALLNEPLVSMLSSRRDDSRFSSCLLCCNAFPLCTSVLGFLLLELKYASARGGFLNSLSKKYPFM